MHHPIQRLLALAVCVLVHGQAPRAEVEGQPPPPSRRLLVKVRSGLGARDLGAALSRAGASGAGLRPLFKTTGWHVVEVAEAADVASLRRALAGDRAVAAVELDRDARVDFVIPNDLNAGQWGLDNTGQMVNGSAGAYDADIDAPEAWELARGEDSVIVAVLDTGVALAHPDLTANLIAGRSYAGGASPDDSGLGHGTAVAGIVGAVGDNGEGIAGVNWNVSMLPVKVCNQEGRCPYSAIVQGVEYAVSRGARVLNMSFSCDEHQDASSGRCGASRPGDCYSEALRDAIQQAGRAGALVVTAAGNCGESVDDATKAYPCSYRLDNVLCVGATDARDELAAFSNYGTRSVRVAAPGTGVLSLTAYPDWNIMWDGTSFASPMAAGVVALQLSRSVGLTPAALVRRTSSGDPQPSLMGHIGGGRLNAYEALRDLFLSPRVVSPSRGGVFNLAGDFDGDGQLDACEAGRASGHRVALGDAASLGPFAPWSQVGSGQGEMAADVNGDGRDDILRRTAGRVEALLSSGSAFGAPSVWATVGRGARIHAADTDGDGRADLIVHMARLGYAIHSSTGTGFAAATAWTRLDAGRASVFADVNGDGRADLVRAVRNAFEVSLSLGDRFAAPQAWAAGGAGARLLAGDLNGDGLADVARQSGDCWDAMLSDGSAFGAPRPWACTPARGSWLLGRFTPDARADLIRVSADGGWQVHASSR